MNQYTFQDKSDFICLESYQKSQRYRILQCNINYITHLFPFRHDKVPPILVNSWHIWGQIWNDQYFVSILFRETNNLWRVCCKITFNLILFSKHAVWDYMQCVFITRLRNNPLKGITSCNHYLNYVNHKVVDSITPYIIRSTYIENVWRIFISYTLLLNLLSD